MAKPFKKLHDDEILLISRKNEETFERLKKERGMTQDIIRHIRDVDKKARIQQQLCKNCYYLEPARCFVQVCTDSYCSVCGCRLTFPTADTDRTCEKCASEKGICKHCGGKMT